MKKTFVLVCALAITLCFILAKTQKTQAGYLSSNNPRQIAQAVGNQDPDSPDFAPGEKADGTLPETYSTPSSTTPKSTATITPVPQESFPSEEDILNMTNRDSGGVGLFEGLFLSLLGSPILSMFVLFFGFVIFIGVIILIVWLIVRKNNKGNQPAENIEKKEKS